MQDPQALWDACPKEAFQRWLQADCPPEDREAHGLEGLFQRLFPLQSQDQLYQIDYVEYHLEVPAHSPEQCKRRGLSFEAPLRVVFRVVKWVEDPASGERELTDVVEQELYFGALPVLTERGTFVFEGTEGIVAHELAPAWGPHLVYPGHPQAWLLPKRGAWLSIEPSKSRHYVRIQGSRRINAAWFLQAFDLDESAGPLGFLQGQFQRDALASPEAAASAVMEAMGRSAISRKEALAGLQAIFMDPLHYELGEVARQRLLALVEGEPQPGQACEEAGPTPLDTLQLLALFEGYQRLLEDPTCASEPWDLANQRLVGATQQLHEICAEGLLRIRELTAQRLHRLQQKHKDDEYLSFLPHDLFNSRPLGLRIERWFQSSPLFQPFEALNPLRSQQHKRRVFVLHPAPKARPYQGLRYRETRAVGGLTPAAFDEKRFVGAYDLALGIAVDDQGGIRAPSEGSPASVLHGQAPFGLRGPRAAEALPLKHPEAPLVRTGWEESLGHGAELHRRATVEGTVYSAEPPEIFVLPDAGDSFRELGRYPLSRIEDQSSLESVCVTPGQRVEAGALLASSPGTLHGALALGTHARVAFVPHGAHEELQGAWIRQSMAQRLLALKSPKRPPQPLSLGLLERDHRRLMEAHAEHGKRSFVLPLVGHTLEDDICDDKGLILLLRGDVLTAEDLEALPRQLWPQLVDVHVCGWDTPCLRIYRDWEYQSDDYNLAYTRRREALEEQHKTPAHRQGLKAQPSPRWSALELGDELCTRQGLKAPVQRICEELPTLSSGESIDAIFPCEELPDGLRFETLLGEVAQSQGSPILAPYDPSFTEADFRERYGALRERHSDLLEAKGAQRLVFQGEAWSREEAWVGIAYILRCPRGEG